jgi:hypothetical protein
MKSIKTPKLKKMTRITFSILLSFFFTSALISCKKQIRELAPQQISVSVKEAQLSIATDIISLAKTNPDFRSLAYNECLKQKFGDYYVRLTDLIKANKGNSLMTTEVIERLLKNQQTIKQKTNREVIIFIPSMEVHPEKASFETLNRNARMNFLDEPVAVVQDEFNNYDQTCPGYVVDNGYSLVFYQTIDEEFAWENDVWVIGEEEVVSEENMVANPADTGTIDYSYLTSRVWGGAEYGGIVKVTDWRQVEPWILGKVEFRYLVYDSKAALRADKKFGKWRRGHFDKKFFDFNHFIGYWTQNAYGDWTTEKWIEEDGVFSMTLTFGISAKIPGTNITGTTNVSIPIKNGDDDLGLSTIQFTDPIGTIYSQSGIEIKRKN